MTPDSDSVRRFAVEHQSVRGQFVRLDAAWVALREHANYPAPVRDLLGQAVSAAVLLASTLKFDGTLTLQLQGNGAVRLLVAQCTSDFRVRAVARFDLARVSDDFRALAGTGQIAVTVEGTQASSRYQGIVPIEGASLSESLEHYFSSSEQLPTAVRLVASEGVTAGLLVQRVPGEGGAGVEGPAGEAARRDEAQRTFAAARAASAALDADALLLLPVAELVRLCLDGFDVRLYAPQAVRFECRCSRARVATMLRSLGAQESREVLAEQGAVTVTCEFCQKPYRFDAVDIEQLFAEVAAPPGSRSVN